MVTPTWPGRTAAGVTPTGQLWTAKGNVYWVKVNLLLKVITAGYYWTATGNAKKGNDGLLQVPPSGPAEYYRLNYL